MVGAYNEYAYTFREIGSDTISVGDPNGDGVINAIDASSVLTYYALISTNQNGGYNGAQKKAADVNKDGVVNGVDASCILSYYAYQSTAVGKIVSLEEFVK